MLSLTRFGSTFNGSVGISVIWGTYHRVVNLSINCEFRGRAGFSGTLAQIGLMYFVVLFFYCIGKDVIK